MTENQAALCGVLLVIVSVFIGYFIRGSNVANDARFKQMINIKESLDSIASKLPEQKVVEKEKIIYSPFCEYSQTIYTDYNIKKILPSYQEKLTDLWFCRRLMYGDMLPKDNLYDSISQWIQESDAKQGSLEDKIMAHVLSVLLTCFKET